MSHADVHRTLGRVSSDGDRPFLHQILEFSALQPGYSRARHPANHRHLQSCLEIRRCVFKAETLIPLQGSEDGVFFVCFCKKKPGGSNFTPWRIWLGTCQTGDTAAPTHSREEEKKRGSLANQERPNGRKCHD